MLCTLNEILEYKNPAVVQRFQKECPEKADQAEDIFQDLLRFFWGTKKHLQDRQQHATPELDFVYIMEEEMRSIDHMWHIFLLYTRDYMAFCDRYFGEYLHHQPDLVPLFEAKGISFEQNLERFLNYNYDLLGENVIRRWFAQ